MNDTIEIINNAIGKVEGQCDTIHILIDQHRKDTIGILQTIRQDIEELKKIADSTDKVEDITRTKEIFDFLIEKIEERPVTREDREDHVAGDE